MEQSPDERAQRLLAAWGPAAQLDGRLAGGNRNHVWAARLAGKRCIARLSARSAETLDWEIDLLADLHEAGMRVPEVLPAADGRRHAEGLVLFTWLEGDPPTSDHDWRLVAEELNRLHEIGRNRPQRPGFRSSLRLLTEQAGGDVRLDLMPEEVVQQVRDAWRALDGEATSAIHGDPGRDNTLILRGRAGFIDWDEARVDVSLLDLAALPPALLEIMVGQERAARAQRASIAWEVANGWIAEPAYARRQLGNMNQPMNRRGGSGYPLGPVPP